MGRKAKYGATEETRETAKQALAAPAPMKYVEGQVPQGIPITDSELGLILDTFLDCRKRGMMLMEAYERTGKLVGRDAKVIGTVIARLRPTSDAAKMYLKAKSLTLTKRLVKKAGPSEIIDILSRPGIEVIMPATRSMTNENTGFFLTVNAESCGAVKVGVVNGGEQKQIEGGTETHEFNPFMDVQGGFGDAERHTIDGESTTQVSTGAEKGLSVIQRARQRIQAARERGE